jgi:predicted transcriptional regulator
MNTDQLARTTFVLQRETHDQLNRISKRLGVSRSTLVRDVLAEPVALMDKWMDAVPLEPTLDDIAAAKGMLQGDLIDFIDRHAAEINELGESGND